MPALFAKRVLTPGGWLHDACITLANGRITAVTANVTPQAELRVDTLLPALGNLHSHTFQRAMAGMTEARAPGKDSFWTWRNLMYRFMDHITPEQYEAIAARAFMEMLETGFASVGEFHYVHHQSAGTAFDSATELTERVFSAAAQTGIGLTHLPVLYTYGGADRMPLSGGQLRFGNSVEGFASLVDQARRIARTTLPRDTTVGIAPHSLRATCPEDLARALDLCSTGPVHIHIAEQPKEVADIQGWLGARPVEWLLQNAPVDRQWCLIHATHMNDIETGDLARSGAVAGLCPITEANLGDGPFNGVRYLAQGGEFGVGTDSNVHISMTGELRTLEYAQRLRDLGRNLMVRDAGSVGQSLYLGAATGGAQALARESGRIEPGALGDMVAIDSSHPTLCTLREDQLLDGLIFAGSDAVIRDVWSAGRHVVRDGRHISHDTITQTYRRAMRTLLDAI